MQVPCFLLLGISHNSWLLLFLFFNQIFQIKSLINIQNTIFKSNPLNCPCLGAKWSLRKSTNIWSTSRTRTLPTLWSGSHRPVSRWCPRSWVTWRWSNKCLGEWVSSSQPGDDFKVPNFEVRYCKFVEVWLILNFEVRCCKFVVNLKLLLDEFVFFYFVGFVVIPWEGWIVQ